MVTRRQEGREMNHSSHAININGNNTFIDVEMTSGNRITSGGDSHVAASPDFAELWQLLAEHRAELVRLGGSRGARVESRIEEIEEEIETGKPDKSRVSSAWDSVLNVLKGSAAGAESVSKISEVVRSLFGA
jgi:hypothetical protein